MKKKSRKKKPLRNLYRMPLQWLIFILLGYMVVRAFVDPNYVADFEAYCPLGGAFALSSLLENNTLACSMTETQIFMGIMLAVGAVLLSKLFCSFICPIGTFTEWLGKIGDKYKVRYTIKGIADRVLRSLKYILLFITAYFTIGSSELFCRQYDPFFAIFSGFGHDVVLWYAIPAVLVMIAGAIFVRQFWCKYLCPLGAATNIFSNLIMFGSVIVIYAILVWLGVPLNWVWLLSAIVILGFTLEVVRMKGLVFPLMKINRVEEICTGCKKCDIACPMAINISEVKTAEHIDCHMCTDCIESCPEPGSLEINKREIRWFPMVATITLILIGLFLGTTMQLPTINERWGTDEQIENAAVFSMDGLKNIKCWGSSASFATKMKKIDGIYGVKTFVQTNGVEILYDPNSYTEDELKAKIFSPTVRMIRNPSAEMVHLSIVEMGIEKLFDTYDSYYLLKLLGQQTGIYGILTEFGEPVHTNLYYDPTVISGEKIKGVIESPSVTYKSGEKEITKNLKFEVVDLVETGNTVTISEFRHLMFLPFDLKFNDFETYSADQLDTYVVYMPQAGNVSLRRRLTTLVSHISWDDGIVRFNTQYLERPSALITFVTDQTNPEAIFESLNKDTLHVSYRGGKTGKVVNPFKFPETGQLVTE